MRKRMGTGLLLLKTDGGSGVMSLQEILLTRTAGVTAPR